MARSIWVAMAGAAALGSAPLLAAAPARAQPAEIVAEPAASINLSQRGIPAEASAENGVLARERALAAGRRIAWERLLAEAGQSGSTLSDQQIEDLVSSIVIEQERTAPTRYSGRITVNFNPNRVRSALGGRGLGGAAPVAGAGSAPAPAGPASNWVEAVATYRSMAEWLELHRRLKAAAPVASVSILGIAVDAARLRVGLRAPPQAAAADLAGLGVALVPGGAAAGADAGPAWRVGLAGGG